MTIEIDYYFGLISPYSFMGLTPLREIAGKAGARINYRPVNLSRVFEATGGLPLAKRPLARRTYRMMELRRWSRRLDVPLNLEPKFFPADETLAANCVVAAIGEGQDTGDLCQAFHEVVWIREENLAHPAVVAAAVERAGFDAGLLDLARKPEAEETRARFTEEAISAGVFGAPTYVVDGELFWGQDRLDFFAEKIGA